ncbi:hypothetical protein IDD31_001161 [Campylobacter coli]|nr:hypothetical protein [Campylobacter coli]EDC2909441.1 hypothetical protein [Campylobacter coli]EGG1782326.1 hypothetical protein [Campylobacter coli]
MKLSEFDFRVWDKDEKCFLDPYTKSRAVVKNLPNEKLLNLEIELFTGLYDKNGNKIYENDIISYKTLKGKTLFYFITTNKNINILQIFVISDLENFKLCNEIDISFLFFDLSNLEYFKLNSEVIGNIHNREDISKMIKEKQ